VLQENEHIQSMTVLEAVRVYSAAYPHPRDPFETLELVGLTEEVGSRIGDALGGQPRLRGGTGPSGRCSLGCCGKASTR
jgi:hypothetical protein